MRDVHLTLAHPISTSRRRLAGALAAALLVVGCDAAPDAGDPDVDGGTAPGDGGGTPGDGGVDPVAPPLPPLSDYADYIDPSAPYQLPLDTDGWAIVTPGAQHKIIYVSSSTGDDDNDGLTEATAVASLDAARGLVDGGSSDWILLRRGDVFGGIRLRGEATGESAEHPMLIGAYGEGARPRLDGSLLLWDTHEHLVLRDLHLRRVGKYCLDVLGRVRNLYLENVVTEGCESRIQGSDDAQLHGVTLHRVMLLDAHHEHDGGWSAHADRISAVYMANVDGILIEESFADHAGWVEGYHGDQSAGPQPPSQFSHDFYLQGNNANIVFRDNIAARGASFGAQVRPGGAVVGNVFVGNNAAFFTAGDRPSLVERNVVTIAGNKRADLIGAIGWGL
ncbi:MAG: hypothetical protein R2939_22035, partial [Kofleriaceae bacterium]